jgi:dipeptidyl-peptidase-4
MKVALLLVLLWLPSARSQDMRAAYERAAKHLPAEAVKLMRNVAVEPVWMKADDKFVYRRQLPAAGEKEFVLVDAANPSTAGPAFDHARFAAALGVATKKTYESSKLPFNRVNSIDADSVEVTAESKLFRCTLSDYVCSEVIRDPEEVVSPDGKWAAFTRNHNLYVRSLSPDRREIALTTDGEPYYAYGAYAGGINAVTDQRSNRKMPALVLWSPDSRRLLAPRTDERNVGFMYLIQASPEQSWPDGGPRRPLLYSYKYPLPGDPDVPRMQLISFEIEAGKRTNLRIPLLTQHGPEHQSIAASLFAGKRAFWSDDSSTAYAVELSRDQKALRFWSASAATGEAKLLLEEKSPTFIEYEVPVQLLNKSKQFLWWSERSGWGHLYLYDLEGKFIRAVTSGDWVVRSASHVDEARGQIFLNGSGREIAKDGDPWIQSVYRASLESGAVTRLTGEAADHALTSNWFAPSGAFFVENYSRIDQAPVTVLRDRDGKVVREIERADVGAYAALKAPPPRAFSAIARDGKTEIYGTLHYPSTFDPKKKYPVLDSDYPGPQTIKAPKRFQAGSVEQAFAELGFIVVQIDGLGKPWRSKAYHDYSYGHMGDTGGLEDHIAALRQLVREHPYLDLDRVGIFGHSGGGFASARAILMFPDFYKVAVSSAGNHDQLGYFYAWGEKYEGPVSGANYDDQDTALLAKNLKGKLMLAYGEMDDNVHPALSVRLIDALIKANKDFDLLMLPNRNHSFSVDPYFNRRRWDYFVKTLLGVEPPSGFELKAVIPAPEP